MAQLLSINVMQPYDRDEVPVLRQQCEVVGLTPAKALKQFTPFLPQLRPNSRRRTGWPCHRWRPLRTTMVAEIICTT